MKYFRVEEEYMEGLAKRRVVSVDGGAIDEAYEAEEIIRIYLGYNVLESDESGLTINVEFYPIETNMRTLADNREEVLEQIKDDYPPEEYQNHDW